MLTKSLTCAAPRALSVLVVTLLLATISLRVAVPMPCMVVLEIKLLTWAAPVALKDAVVMLVFTTSVAKEALLATLS